MQKPPAGTFPADTQKVAFDKAKGHLSHRKTWHFAMQNAVDCKPGCKHLALNTLATAHHPPAFGRASAPNYTPKKIPLRIQPLRPMRKGIMYYNCRRDASRRVPSQPGISLQEYPC